MNMKERRNGNIVQDFAGGEEQLTSALSEREVLAVQTLEGIRCVLENGRLSNEDCCRRIDHLIRLYYQELDIKIGRGGGKD